MEKFKKIPHINLIFIIVVIIMLIIIGITITMARYRSTGSTEAIAEVALMVFDDSIQEANMVLTDLYPSEESYEYEFTVTNTKTNEDGTTITAETSLEYTVQLDITTNLPLEFKIYKGEDELIDEDDIENSVVLDKTGETYIRRILIKNGNFTYDQAQEDKYIVSVQFPIEYATVEEFEGMVDNIAIVLDAKQKIEE